MGIVRLWSYIRENRDALTEYVDLVKVAKGFKSPMKILVDFYAWEHYLKEKFWTSLQSISNNSSLMFDGGEYKAIDLFTKSLIQSLREVNIEPVFFLDGAKGSAEESSKQKMNTWKDRFFEEQKRLQKFIAYLRGEIPLSEVPTDHLTRPCLQEVQNVATLQELGCEIHLRVSGEADYVIAKRMSEDPEAFCIFSNDTDFCIFKDSVYLPAEYFDLENNLRLGLKSLEATVPRKLICRILRSENIAKHFKFQSTDSLVELAIMGGNDFTAPYLTQHKKYFGTYRGKMDRLAYEIRRSGTAEKCDFYKNVIAQSKELQGAVLHARQFYTLTLEDEEENEPGLLFALIVKGIQAGKLPSTITAIYRGLYWHRQVLEDPLAKIPTADGAMADLRSFVYAMVLPEFRSFVTEIGRSAFEVFDQQQVFKSKSKSVPTLAQVRRNDFAANMSVFETIIQHKEKSPLPHEKSYFTLYGSSQGFLCYLLRYILVQNWDQNLFMSPREWLVMAAWVLGNHDDAYHQRMRILPSPRCVTLENWFMCLYRTAFAFLGNLLDISQVFPSPREVFSGAVWVALYTAVMVHDPIAEHREPPPLSVPPSQLASVFANVKRTVKSNEPVIRTIIRGLFPADELDRLP